MMNGSRRSSPTLAPATGIVDRIALESLLSPAESVLACENAFSSMTWRQAAFQGIDMYRGRTSLYSSDSYIELLSLFIRQTRPQTVTHIRDRVAQKRRFHDYFVTHLPSSSLHPDSRSATGLAHKFPRKESTPHSDNGRIPPATHPSISRDTTVVRIPLKSAKHHYGVFNSRGSRPYNEDTYQAGVIELPAFAKRPPLSLRIGEKPREATSADGASGDPQVFYFGVFDGHGGSECSEYLKAKLHEYIESTASKFDFKSSLKGVDHTEDPAPGFEGHEEATEGQQVLDNLDTKEPESAPREEGPSEDGRSSKREVQKHRTYDSDPPLIQKADQEVIRSSEEKLIQQWKTLVGGYFRRFKPAYFSIFDKYQSLGEESESFRQTDTEAKQGMAIEEVMTYAFLRADYDFVAEQAARHDRIQEALQADRPLNESEILGKPNQRHKPVSQHSSTPDRFRGGSTCSVALISTPSPTPFWNASTTSSMLVAHVGDTRIIICSTTTGTAVPLTTDHHPSSPVESNRLRRYAASFVTDSFGEERILGLANTRAFGDIASKRMGVSAEPEIKRVELGAAEYSFVVLVSDGVSGTLSDQEIVDIVKEAKTPEQAAKNVVDFATEVTREGDNATCVVVRLGGWERRQEGGHGSLGTKESREFKRQDAADPRNRRQ